MGAPKHLCPMCGEAATSQGQDVSRKALEMARKAVLNHVESFRPWTEKVAGRINPWQPTLDAVEAALAHPHQGGGRAIADIAAERWRQIETEGWTPEHDDEHTKGELAQAAACYARLAANHGDGFAPEPCPIDWPWSVLWWKPTERRRDLVKAGALIVAEIERLDRADTP